MVLRVLGISLAFALVSSAACARPQEPACSGTDVLLTTPGKLTIAADYSYPPFAFRSPDGDLVGYEVDLARAVASEMRLEPAFVNRGTGSLIAGLLAHRHDVAASGLRSTPGLKDAACPSASYLDADLGILVPAANPHAIAEAGDMDGRTVAVLDESDAEDWALENLDRSSIASLPTADDLFTALRQARADAVVVDLPLARFSVKEAPDFRVAGKIETNEGYVLVGADDNGPLITGINGALARLRTEGRLAKMERKWFGG